MTSSSFETSNNSTDPSTTVPSLSNLPFTISVKLNSSNYPIWKAQALPYFRGQGVFGYLDGTIPSLPQEIDAPHPGTGAIIKIPNSQYNLWLRQDSLILTTINASLTEDVLTQVMSYPTSRKDTHVQFAAPSPLHMASTSSPQIDLRLASGSPARDTTLPQHADSSTHPPLPSPPRPQQSEYALHDYKEQKQHPQAKISI
ncbi:hypothetical protein F0562_008094 [Nyssa sinensis]|uniref:Retrotransposon Copia-like N-terminal domain-containing protein n=1 Tax=Nyssa sinensis TaxID=561372 RepID=A0A5J5A9U4_9ASTE|nr:hypothetical protein F0562_008094 [Nyssa sinensis]